MKGLMKIRQSAMPIMMKTIVSPSKWVLQDQRQCNDFLKLWLQSAHVMTFVYGIMY